MRKQDADLVINNQEVLRYYMDEILGRALAQFEYDGLPETCDRWYLERSAVLNTAAAIYKPDQYDFLMSTGFVFNGRFNPYGRPMNTPIIRPDGTISYLPGIEGIDYTGNHYPSKNFVILYDNVLHTSIYPKIELYARLLAETHLMYRANLKHLATPWLVTGSKNTKLSIQNIMNRILGFQPYVILKDDKDAERVKTLDMRVEFEGDRILNCLQTLWKQAMDLLGISTGTVKKERMLQDEIAANEQDTLVSRNTRLLPRREFCEECNRKFGLNMSVKYTTMDTTFRPYDFNGEGSGLPDE